MKDYIHCPHPWVNVNILSDGTVKPCCWCKGHIGNLNRETFDEIWNGNKVAELRQSILDNKIHPMCKNAPCPFKTEIADE